MPARRYIQYVNWIVPCSELSNISRFLEPQFRFAALLQRLRYLAFGVTQPERLTLESSNAAADDTEIVCVEIILPASQL
jgi:hypothetical protein